MCDNNLIADCNLNECSFKNHLKRNLRTSHERLMRMLQLEQTCGAHFIPSPHEAFTHVSYCPGIYLSREAGPSQVQTMWNRNAGEHF